MADELVQAGQITSKDVANRFRRQARRAADMLYYAVKWLWVHAGPPADGGGQLRIVGRRHFTMQSLDRAEDHHHGAQAVRQKLYLRFLVPPGSQDPLSKLDQRS